MSDFQTSPSITALPSKRPPNDLSFSHNRQLYDGDGESGSFADLVAGIKPPAVDFESMDSLAALLADEFGFPLKLAERVEAWFAENEDASVNLRAGTVVRAVLERVCNSKNPAITAEAIRASFGFARGNDDTLRATARNIGCTVAALSKRALKIRQALGLKVCSFSKTEDARNAYKAFNGRNPDGSPKRSRKRRADLPAIESGSQSAPYLASRDSGPPRAEDGQCDGTQGQA